MWPLYLLFNKFLKTDEENVHQSVGDHLTVVEGFPFEQSVNNEKGTDATLPRSHFVEVSPCCCSLLLLEYGTI